MDAHADRRDPAAQHLDAARRPRGRWACRRASRAARAGAATSTRPGRARNAAVSRSSIGDERDPRVAAPQHAVVAEDRAGDAGAAAQLDDARLHVAFVDRAAAPSRTTSSAVVAAGRRRARRGTAAARRCASSSAARAASSGQRTTTTPSISVERVERRARKEHREAPRSYLHVGRRYAGAVDSVNSVSDVSDEEVRWTAEADVELFDAAAARCGDRAIRCGARRRWPRTRRRGTRPAVRGDASAWGSSRSARPRPRAARSTTSAAWPWSWRPGGAGGRRVQRAEEQQRAERTRDERGARARASATVPRRRCVRFMLTAIVRSPAAPRPLSVWPSRDARAHRFMTSFCRSQDGALRSRGAATEGEVTGSECTAKRALTIVGGRDGAMIALLAACGSDSKTAAPVTTTTAKLEVAGPNPSVSAQMICGEAKEDIAAAGRRCRHGEAARAEVGRPRVLVRLRLQGRRQDDALGQRDVERERDDRVLRRDGCTTRSRRQARGARRGRVPRPTNGSVVVRKDYRVLLVDVSHLPAQFGQAAGRLASTSRSASPRRS